MAYTGRFAPSPTGPLHAGSLVAALASWLDAKANNGKWLVRLEDVDTPRCVPGADHLILQQLSALGLVPNAAPVVQSQRTRLYQQALDTLAADGAAYPCQCSRKDIDAALTTLGHPRQRHGELVYPGTCRPGLTGPAPTNNIKPCAWRLRTDIFRGKQPLALVSSAQTATESIASSSHSSIEWTDRRLDLQVQNVEKAVGDFPLKRADGCFTYQLAVVVDDAAQGITHVVRGEDLADNTARQILLQHRLRLPTPAYMHTPLVLGANGEKLSKQNGAQALDTTRPLVALHAAAGVLGLNAGILSTTHSPNEALASWVNAWRHLYPTA